MSGSDRSTTEILVPVSVGEVVDKVTILRIKRDKIADPMKLANIRRELSALESTCARHGLALAGPEVDALQAVNAELWKVEDEIRDCEREQDFGEAFVRLARQVYVLNDERFRCKRKINELHGSALVEEKSYRQYR